MLLRGANAVGYTSYPDNVVNAFCREATMAGVDIFRIFDSLNYIDNLKFGIDAVRAAGGIVEGTICYTGDVSNPGENKVGRSFFCCGCVCARGTKAGGGGDSWHAVPPASWGRTRWGGCMCMSAGTGGRGWLTWLPAVACGTPCVPQYTRRCHC